MRKKILLLTLIALIIQFDCRADEGMWIPMLLKKYNMKDMQKQGFKLTAEDVYSINQASLKDAVIGLGREDRPFSHFCTGNLVSKDGLVITNHHCSFDMIQAHSSLEHNYLRDGFWAPNKQEELANPGITASVLVRMEDVTEKITSRLTDDMSENERKETIKKISTELEKEAVKGTDLKANVRSYFNGNQYFMSVFRIFKDVRLVGAPPSAVGKFGGDTDNWMWPRHTGDFSVLRIYADPNNQPASYSKDNQPYQPEKHFKISTAGVKEGDFTMVFGYPGTTNEYLTSYAIEQLQNLENPHKVTIRTAKLNVMNAAMESDELLRIQYAAKAASVANAWKKWQGETKGLKRFNTIAKKQELEREFKEWAINKERYNSLINKYEETYDRRKDLILAYVYVSEAGLNGSEAVKLASDVWKDVKSSKPMDAKQWKEKANKVYKNYNLPTDEKILAEMLRLYNHNLSSEWIPMEIAKAKDSTSYESYASNLLGRSIFKDSISFNAWLNSLDTEVAVRELEKDPIYQLAASLNEFYIEKIESQLSMIQNQIDQLNRVWMAGLMEMKPKKTFYPDANSTLRVAYGKIGGYSPLDGVDYKYYTTLDGIMEKDNPEIYDYDVPQKLRELYQSKDFGNYSKKGEMPVCFIASNHTTGGNSGSPVLNARGELIGLNFDRAWDGVMSDLQYDPTICRNISVDIRYVLFIVDKLGGAKHLINEMEIVNK